MATNTDQIVTQLVADTKKFDGAMNGSIEVIKRFNKAGEEIGSRVKVVTKHLEEASSKTNSFRDSMTRLSRDIKVTNTIFDTLAGSITKAYSAASEGSKIMAAEQFFKNAGKSIEEYRKATNGMVSDAELMKKANLADSMGINEKTFKQLVMVAEASALKTGQSFDYMFNSIIVGTARSSRLLLDNLGIIVSVGQANETYAAKVNKTVEALSAEEKQLAFVEEVARQSQGTLDEYANTTDRTAESFARFDASMQNTIDTLKVGLAKVLSEFLPGLTSFFDDVKTLLQSQDWGSLGEYLGLRLVEGLAGALKVGGSSIWRKWMDETIANVRKEADALVLKSEFAAMDKKTEQEDQLTSLLKSFRKATGDDLFYDREKILADVSAMSKETLDAMRKSGEGALAGLIEAIKETASALGVLPRVVQKVTGPTPKSDRKQGITSSDLHSAEAAFDKWLAATEEKDFVAEGRALAAPFSSSVVQFDNGISRHDQIMKKWLKDWEEVQKQVLKDMIEFNRPVGDAVTAIGSGQGLVGPIAGAIGQMSGGITEGITSALSGVMSGATAGAVAGPLGAALGALAGLLFNIIDGLKPVTDLLGSIMVGLEQLVRLALGEILSGLPMLGTALQDLLAAVGVLVGAALRPLVNIVTLVIGVVSGIVSAVSTVVVGLSPFIEMLVWFISAIATSGLNLFGLFFDLNVVVGNLNAGFMWFIDTMLGGAISFNNMIVKIARDVFGLKGFGKYLDRDDFRPPSSGGDDPIDANTSALDENTQALRDFTREFRNLPQSYKVAGAIYATQNAETKWRGTGIRTGIGERSVDGFANGRWRT